MADRVAEARAKADQQFAKKVETHKRSTWTTANLLSTDFPPMRWAAPRYVPEGLVILAGRPKIGKSWLLMQLAVAVGTGGMFFGTTGVWRPTRETVTGSCPAPTTSPR